MSNSFENRGPWATLRCPHCGRWPEFWTWHATGLASEYRPVRVCPYGDCRKEVPNASVCT